MVQLWRSTDRISKVARRALDDANGVDIQHMVIVAPDESVSLAEPFPNCVLNI